MDKLTAFIVSHKKDIVILEVLLVTISAIIAIGSIAGWYGNWFVSFISVLTMVGFTIAIPMTELWDITDVSKYIIKVINVLGGSKNV